MNDFCYRSIRVNPTVSTSPGLAPRQHRWNNPKWRSRWCSLKSEEPSDPTRRIHLWCISGWLRFNSDSSPSGLVRDGCLASSFAGGHMFGAVPLHQINARPKEITEVRFAFGTAHGIFSHSPCASSGNWSGALRAPQGSHSDRGRAQPQPHLNRGEVSWWRRCSGNKRHLARLLQVREGTRAGHDLRDPADRYEHDALTRSLADAYYRIVVRVGIVALAGVMLAAGVLVSEAGLLRPARHPFSLSQVTNER